MKILFRLSFMLLSFLLGTNINAQATWTATAGNTLTAGGSLPSSPLQWLGSANAADLIFKTTNAERFRVTSTGSIGIGTSSPLHFVDIKVPAISGSENVINFAVSDASGDYFKIYNGTGGVNTFMPILTGFKTSSSIAGPAIGIIGTIASGLDGVLDQSAIVSFGARRDVSGSQTFVSNRPLFSWSNYTTQYMMMTADGKVGINTPSPAYKLAVTTTVTNDGIQVLQTGLGAAGLHLDNSGSGGHNWGIFSNGSNNFEGAGNFSIYDYGTFSTRLLINGTTGNVGIGTGTFQPTAKLTVNGKVLIGDPAVINLATTNSYSLYVQAGILTEKVKVAIATSSSWADYVYEKGYKILDLNELEKFVKENKHLPNIPSATEMVKEGLDVATMDAKLLEKIEELSLYIIAQNKRIEALEAKK
jgi:hypothetical protein